MPPESHTEGLVYIVVIFVALAGYRHIRGKELPDLVLDGE